VKGVGSTYPKLGNPVTAVVGGALIAVVVLLAGSYLLTRFGIGLFGSDAPRLAGVEMVKRAGLNAFAVQCVSLVGSGSVSSGVGGSEAVRGTIALPVTCWMVLPFVALLVGGYAAGCLRRCDSIASAVWLSFFFAVTYGVILAVLSRLVSAQMNSGLLPEISGVTVSPPRIDFSPGFWSSLGHGWMYGMVFAYLGVLASLRRSWLTFEPGQWWVSGKSVVVVCLVISFVFGAVLSVRVLSSQEVGGVRGLEMVPAACGIAYTLSYGASAIGDVSSEITAVRRQTHPLAARAGLYSGLNRNDDNGKSVKPFGAGVMLGGALVAIVASFIAGFLAVKWGSRDGALPTACRVLVVQIGCLLLLALSCRLAITSTSQLSSTSVYVGIGFGWMMVPALIVSFLAAMVSAGIAASRGAGLEAYGPAR
jgi:hypothetical protein